MSVLGILLKCSATKDDVACQMGFSGCCCCPPVFVADKSLCPEWSTSDTVLQLSIYFKLMGIIAFLCMSYHIGALAVSSLVHQNLKNYKTDYI